MEKLNDQSNLLTGAKQTMAAWSKVIETYEAIPAAYKDFFETYIADDQHFPYIVFTPVLIKPKGKTTEKLIYDADNAIHILERNGSRVNAKSYPYQTICKVEVGNVLLSSWLTISGITSAGEWSASTIDFNTTSTRYFTTFLNKLRPTPQGVDNAKLNAEKEKFNYLSGLSFKFMNFGRSSLIHGEIVHNSLLQSEIREPILRIFGTIFQRTVSPTHLTVLTNQELILIHERDREVAGPQYGGVWQYIPLRSIASISLAEAANDRIMLSITLSSSETINTLFVVSSQPKLESLCTQVQELIREHHAVH